MGVLSWSFRKFGLVVDGDDESPYDFGGKG